MLSLEQIRALESRVEKTISLIASLRAENSSLREGLGAAEARVRELESLISLFQKDQAKIEEGILDVLRKLDDFEDKIHNKDIKLEPKTDEEPIDPETSPSFNQLKPINTIKEKSPETDSSMGDGLDIF